MVLKIDCRNIDCIKKTIIVINNHILKNGGNISIYDNELLIALLGENWNKEYCIGKSYKGDVK